MKGYLVLLFVILSTLSEAEELRFSLHKIQSDKSGPTILVIGGIQGDEPGGFTAASLLVTNYTVSAGNIWVVPNLNFESIIKRSRGIHGDMNRKFKTLSENDPEFDEVQKIKQIILDENVDVVLNLHDGSGFYTEKYIDKWRNPDRWGQSIIIDQKTLNVPEFGALTDIATKVQQHINRHLEDGDQSFYVKNTETRQGDVEMEKSLTYFSITNKRPAFAVEASKHFRTHERTFYHLLAVEGFLHEMGIKYQRNFELTMSAVDEQIGKNLNISLYDNRVNLAVEKARPFLNYIPLNKLSPLIYTKSNPLIAVVRNKNELKVRYGNRYLTSLNPQYFEYDNNPEFIKMQVDGADKIIKIGERISVKNNFRVLAETDYRVNVIGYTKNGIVNENGHLIKRASIQSRYSIDKSENIFRVELYKGDKFSGMILVDFESAENQEYKPQSSQESYSMNSPNMM